MNKKDGFNRNVIGNKRPHRGISRSWRNTNIQDMSLTMRLYFECKVLSDYHDRIKK